MAERSGVMLGDSSSSVIALVLSISPLWLFIQSKCEYKTMVCARCKLNGGC